MSLVDEYLEAADRDNTRKSYASAIRHFEVEWKGLLPATGESVARYLADYGERLSINTLRLRLAALSRWHGDHGFSDPTKASIVRQVLKGIRAKHSAPEKRARPVQIDMLHRVSDWLARGEAIARRENQRQRILTHTRDHALVLIGFWRGFRADDLASLQIEHTQLISGEGLVCFLPHGKGDRDNEGQSFRVPALSRLCPVSAYQSWITASGLTRGPVFRKIDRWGNIGEEALSPNSINPLLRRLYSTSGVESPEEYSGHSLRRGFAGWARSAGWDLKELMEYVGWKDIKSAMRYMEVSDASLKERFEQGLQMSPRQQIPASVEQPKAAHLSPKHVEDQARVLVNMELTRFNPTGRGQHKARKVIEQTCLARHGMQPLDATGTRYQLAISYQTREELDDIVYALLDDMHRVADNHQCFINVTCREPTSGASWE